MSYQVLARKWRPHNFSQVIGQQHVLTALSNSLTQNKVHHAYLFSGTRGVGKTTIARILAKSLNCEQGVTATPCGTCEHCVAIDQGRFVDLLEIDAASRTKVDDTRELLDNVQYKPAVGRYKVYLIDEIHMLSKHSFNALLKTLEEPPEYVKFLLATTDPQKLPITVLSRCLQFHLKALSADEIETQLAFILQQEQAIFEHTALSVIAKAADGSMRDALSLTDQALAFGAGNIEYQSVLKMLGTLDNSHLEYLLHFIASGNVDKVFQKIAEFVLLGADFSTLHQELASLCHQISLQQLQPLPTTPNKSAIQLISERLSPEEVQLYYQIALQGYKDYVFAPNGKIAFEMTVMRLLAFKPANYIELDENAVISCESVNQSTHTNNVTDEVISPATVVTSVLPPVSIETEASVETMVSVSQLGEHAETKDSEQQSPITQVTKPIVQDSIVDESIVADSISYIEAIPVIQNAPVETIEPSGMVSPVQNTEPKQVTNSRNMLRSHRLKRNEIKKSQATTDLQVSDSVVAAKPDTDKNISILLSEKTLPEKPDIVAESVVSGVFSHENIVPEQKIFSPAPQMSENIAPIEQYQDSEFEANNINSEYNNSYDDSGYEPYSSPEEAQQAVSQHFDKRALEQIPNSVSSSLITHHSTLGKHDFFTDQAFEAVEIDRAKYVEDKLTDTWSLAIQTMKLVGLVKLLAKNSVMKKVDKQIVLTLKTEQQHLLNDSSLCEELQAQLKNYYGEEFNMYIELGNVTGALTAFESEMMLYEQYLDNAKRAIVEDVNIKALVSNCGAKVYENSVIPL